STTNTPNDKKENVDTAPSKMNEESLVDLRFPSPHNSPQYRYSKIARLEPSSSPSHQMDQDEPPPPYPGLPSHMLQAPGSTLHFPTPGGPPPYQPPATIQFPMPSGMGMASSLGGMNNPPPYGMVSSTAPSSGWATASTGMMPPPTIPFPAPP